MICQYSYDIDSLNESKLTTMLISRTFGIMSEKSFFHGSYNNVDLHTTGLSPISFLYSYTLRLKNTQR